MTPPPGNDAAVHQQLGALDAKVDRILADQDQARQDRKQQYVKSEAMERGLDAVKQRMDGLASRLDKIEPITADISRWKERFIGMRMLVIFIAAAFGATIATTAKWIGIKLGFVSG